MAVMKRICAIALLLGLPVTAFAQTAGAMSAADATAAVETMRTAIAQVEAMRNAAEGSGDNARLYQCITNEWSTMNGRLQVAESAAAALAAPDATDASRAQNSELVTLAAAAIQVGADSARRCSQTTTVAGDDQRQSTTNSNIPTYNTSDGVGGAGGNGTPEALRLVYREATASF